MSMVTRENIQNSKNFNDIEKRILEQMLKWENYFKSQGRDNEEVFICTNESGLIEIGAHSLFEAIKHLSELGILKRRECAAVAYEWNDKAVLERMLMA